MDLVFIWLPCNSLLKGGPQPSFRIGGETRCASHEPWGNILWCGSNFYLTVKVFELSLLPRVFLFFWSSVFYFSMTGNMKLCAGHSAWSWSCIFFKGRIFTPVIFSEQVSQKAVSYFHACFVMWSSYLSSIGFGSDISVSRAEITVKSGSSAAVCCSTCSL